MSNLNAALAQVDHQRPQNSPLLTVPRAPHGGMDRPVLGPQQAKLVAQLIDWVALVTNTPVANEALATAAPTPDAFAPEPPGNVQLANYEERETLFPPSAGPRYGAQLRPWQPKDPFDPEIFNRRFHSGNNGAQ
jgi:hypothetical protein